MTRGVTTSALRRHALSIFRASVAAADPGAAVKRHLERIDFSRFRNVYVVGAGKAAVPMAEAAEHAAGRRLTAGFLNVKNPSGARLRRIELQECGHPVPDQRGVEGAQRIAHLVEIAGRDDLVICLISGGASALMP